jgi:uncharacterized membrane protein (UPF0127 family)
MHRYTDHAFLDRLIDNESSKLAEKVFSYLSANYKPEVLGWVKDADWREASIPLDDIKDVRRPGGRNMEKVQAIADKVKAGQTGMPVVLVETGKNEYVVADGYHRTLAFAKAGRSYIKAFVASGNTEGFDLTKQHAAKTNVKSGETASVSTSMTGLHVHPQSTPIGQAPYTTQPPNTTPGYPMAPVHIQPADRLLNCRTASTPADRARGFQNTPDPEDFAGDALLFQWPGLQQTAMTNKNVNFPVSVVWFDENGKYVDHAHMLPGDATPKMPKGQHKSALEFHTRNWSSLGLGPGSSMSMAAEKDQSKNGTIMAELKEAAASMTKEDKNPKGGLSRKGRNKYAKEGHNLKPGVKSYGSASLPDKKRWISWACRFAGIGTVPPLTKPNGEPTRFALSFPAWGEPTPKTVADVRKTYAKAKSRQAALGA